MDDYSGCGTGMPLRITNRRLSEEPSDAEGPGCQVSPPGQGLVCTSIPLNVATEA